MRFNNQRSLMKIWSPLGKHASFVVMVLFPFVMEAQEINLSKDLCPQHHRAWKKVVGVPALLIATSLISFTDNEVFDRYEIHEDRNRLTPQFRTHIDDYVQYAPIAAVYALNLAGVKGQHDVINQTVLLIKTEILMTAFVFPLKKITAVPRPDTGERNSFPSGHTAQAFAAATFLHKEYGKQPPLYSVIAYTTAAGVSVLRVLNNRHWVSDVLAGAGIGILSTNLVYLTHQNRWGRKHGKGSMAWAPSYGNHAFLMSAVITLK
jgi:hypothetical protein